VSLLSKTKLAERLLASRKVRDAYVYEHVRNGVPFQIRALRKDRDWSQAELAEAASTSRTVITRIEDPNYGKLTLKTLLEIASAFEVALLVKFVPFSRLVREYEDVSSVALSAKSVSDKDEAIELKAWANEIIADPVASHRKVAESENIPKPKPSVLSRTTLASTGNSTPDRAKVSALVEARQRQATVSFEDLLASGHPSESSQPQSGIAGIAGLGEDAYADIVSSASQSGRTIAA
jgi:transcriptional regulator with XRE-family HTH domain